MGSIELGAQHRNELTDVLYQSEREYNSGLKALWGELRSDLGEFDSGMAAASLAGKAGFVSPEGEWVIEPKFDRCYRFVSGLAMVRAGNTYSYISRSGVVGWRSEPHAMPQAPPFKE